MKTFLFLEIVCKKQTILLSCFEIIAYFWTVCSKYQAVTIHAVVDACACTNHSYSMPIDELMCPLCRPRLGVKYRAAVRRERERSSSHSNARTHAHTLTHETGVFPLRAKRRARVHGFLCVCVCVLRRKQFLNYNTHKL